MKEIRFTNFVFDPQKYYLLYLGEIKGQGIGYFFKDAVARVKNIERDNIVLLSIVPDILGQYNYEDVIVVNRSQKKENQRQSNDHFMQEVSQSPYVHEVIDQILAQQGEVYLYMFESNPHMLLDQQKGVILVGPSSDIVTTLSNKISLYEIFSDTVPMASYYVCQGLESLRKKAEAMLGAGIASLFVSLEKSAAGANSLIVQTMDEIMERFGEHRDATYLVTEFIPHVSDPTTLGVVINEEEVFIAGIADQKINGTRFEGSIFPSKLSTEIQDEILRQSREVGKKMAQLGYRGIFGCDFIVTDRGAVYFIETNPRKQGTTMEFCCVLEGTLPEDAPNLPELEFYAVLESRSAPNLREPDFEHCRIYWETYNYKVHQDVRTHQYLPQYNNEREMFAKVFRNKIKKEFMVLEHAGEDFVVRNGSFLGRVIAVGNSYEDVKMGIAMGTKILDSTCDILDKQH